MGTNLTYKCNKCEYNVMTSGGPDYGMTAVTDTYICKSCDTIIDVCVGEHGNTYSKEEALRKKDKSLIDMQYYICPACKSGENLIKWNKLKRPCPKCNGKMIKDPKGMVVEWD